MIKNNFLRLLFIFIFFQLSLVGQNVSLTKERVERLTSSEFHGRGYVKNGVNITANYIKYELESIGVKSFDKSFFQTFTTDVNTFPSTVEVKLGNGKLIPGVDYVLGPSMPTVKGKYELFVLDSVLLNNADVFAEMIYGKDLSKKMLVIDHKLINDERSRSFYLMQIYTNFLNFAGNVELISSELLASVSHFQQEYPSIKIKREVFSNKEEEIFINIKSKFIKNFETKNVIGYIEGYNNNEFIVFSAHYDHIGRIGREVYIPGAQDNASGTAFLLDLAGYYSRNKPKYSVMFIFFGGEELGLLGSKYYVTNPLFDLSKIKLVINLDMVGTGDEGITIVNGKNHDYRKEWELFEKINKENNFFSIFNARGESDNSDHSSFHRKGIPAIFIYTMGGNTFYHNVKDRAETLTFTGYNQLFELLIKFISVYE